MRFSRVIEADKLAKARLDKHRIPLKDSSNERQAAYRQMRVMSAEPQDIDLAKPKSWMKVTSARNADGREMSLPTYQLHMLCGEDGAFPAELNAWETDVLKTEVQRKDFKSCEC